MTSHTLSDHATILLVGAQDCAATDLRETLVSSGYTVRLAGSGASAQAMLEVVRPDLILLDLMLPDTDGLVLCRQLSVRTNAPIIVLTARHREVDRMLALEMGASDFVTEPVDVCQLLPVVKAALADSGPVRQLASAR